MRLLRVAAAVIIVLFVADLAAAAVGAPSLGISITSVNAEPSEPELPVMPSDPDTGQPEPEAPVVPSVDNGELDNFNQLVSSVSGSFPEGTFVTKRTFGSGWVTVEMRSKPQTLEYMVTTSYGCSLLAGGSTHGYGAMKVCAINDFLPVAPAGFSRERWWYLMELDAFGEGTFARYAAAQGTISQSGGPISAWGEGFMQRVFNRDDYLAWVREMYADHFSRDFRGVTYNEQTVAASCGGVWLLWAGPWGCVNVQVYFQSRLLSAGYSQNDADRHIYDLLYHTQTDPIGVEGDKWPSQAGAPPMDGGSVYQMGSNVFQPTDAKPLMGRSFRLTVTESFTNVFPTSNQDLLTADVKVEMSDGVGWKEVTTRFPCSVVSGNDLAHCSDEETFGIGAVAGWSALRTQVGGLTWSEKMWRYVLNKEGEAVKMADGDWSKITNYLDSRSLIDRLIFAAWYEVNKPTGGGTAIDHAISVFNEKLTTGDWWGLDDLSLLMTFGTSGRAESGLVCELVLMKAAGDSIKRGEVARYNLPQQCAARFRAAYPSGGGSLLSGSLVLMLMPSLLYMFPVAGVAIVEINNWLLFLGIGIVPAMLVADFIFARRRAKTKRRF